MKLLKRTRTSRTKLLKGQTAKGEEFYYSRKPSQRRSDYVDSKAKAPPAEKVPSLRIKKQERS